VVFCFGLWLVSTASWPHTSLKKSPRENPFLPATRRHPSPTSWHDTLSASQVGARSGLVERFFSFCLVLRLTRNAVVVSVMGGGFFSGRRYETVHYTCMYRTHGVKRETSAVTRRTARHLQNLGGSCMRPASAPSTRRLSRQRPCSSRDRGRVTRAHARNRGLRRDSWRGSAPRHDEQIREPVCVYRGAARPGPALGLTAPANAQVWALTLNYAILGGSRKRRRPKNGARGPVKRRASTLNLFQSAGALAR
jgi:hypothetical protein